MNSRGNDIIIWVVALLDMLLGCILLYLFFRYLPSRVPPSLIYGLKSSMVVMCVSIIITSFVFPSVVHHRELSWGTLFRRNLRVCLLETFIFCAICRLMTHSGNYAVFFVSYGISIIILTFLLRIIERFSLNFLRVRGRNTRSVLFVGSDPANLMVYNKLMLSSVSGYRVVGYYSNGDIVGAPAEFKKLGTRDDLRRIINGTEHSPVHFEELYCSLSRSNIEELEEIITYCDQHVARFFYVPRIEKNLSLSLVPQMMGNMVVYASHNEPLMSYGNRVMKRAFDIVLSLVVLICMLPFLPVIAYFIKKQSPGPIFFKQERTGINGKNFMCYKFRSMHVNDQADKLQATKDDPRKFSFGDFMRRTNIDEFPQFFNVLIGDMSVVGPRPHMIYHTEKYSSLIGKYMVRHFCRPGITGYAQISGFRGETEALWQMEGRVEKDIWYIEHWSMWLDLKIVILTALSVVFPDKSAY